MSDPLYDIARSAVAERLSVRSFAHSEATALTAESLAKVYGVDPRTAALTGLLHDWSREESPAHLIQCALEMGIPVGPVEREVPYLLHAGVGAENLRLRFPGISPGIVSAVRHHTLGSVTMNELDMIVYVADMIEPLRRYEGATHLRSLVGNVTLSELYASAYQVSFHQLIRDRNHLHPMTVDAWNAIVATLPVSKIPVS